MASTYRRKDRDFMAKLRSRAHAIGTHLGDHLKTNEHIPLLVSAEMRAQLIRVSRYKHADTVDLCLEASTYLQHRLRVTDRALAIGILLGRDALK